MTIEETAVARSKRRASIIPRVPEEEAMREWMTALSRDDLEEAIDEADEIFEDIAELVDDEAIVIRCLSLIARCPVFADAYTSIGYARPRDAMTLFVRGIQAAQLLLGPDLRAYKGTFWSDLATRPYIQARYSQAAHFRREGRVGEAVTLFRELLELCPADNLGVRYDLVNTLLLKGDYAGAKVLTRS